MSAIAGFVGILGLAVFASRLAFSMGYQASLAGSRRTMAMIPLIVAFGVVFCLALDLDRPQQGILRVDQSPMMRLAETLKAD